MRACVGCTPGPAALLGQQSQGQTTCAVLFTDSSAVTAVIPAVASRPALRKRKKVAALAGRRHGSGGQVSRSGGRRTGFPEDGFPWLRAGGGRAWFRDASRALGVLCTLFP